MARGASAARVLIVLASLLAPGCGDRPPAIPLQDARVPPSDAADAGARDSAPARRPDAAAVLPPVDREIVLPFLGASANEDLEVQSNVGRLDVQLSIDTTGSFAGEIDALQEDLVTRIVPGLRARVDDVAFGVSRFEDFPVPPFGNENDAPFTLLTAITTDFARLGGAVSRLDSPLGSGGDLPESGAEALYQIATGEGYPDLVDRFTGSSVAPGGGAIGGAGFREGSLRAVVHITDAPSHDGADYAPEFAGVRGLTEAADALAAVGARVIGIASGEPGRTDLELLARLTGAMVEPSAGQCPTGIDGAPRAPIAGSCPLVFDIRADGTGLADAVVSSIADLLDSVQYAEAWAEADDPLRFVRSLEALAAVPAPGSDPPRRADRRPIDGIDDTFVEVRQSARLTFRATLRNETIPPADYDQRFVVTLRVLGDGVLLASRSLGIVVPRGRLVPDGGLDAGTDATGLDASDSATPDAVADGDAVADARPDAP